MSFKIQASFTVITALVLGLLFAIGVQAQDHPAITVEPAKALVDETTTLRASGLPPDRAFRPASDGYRRLESHLAQ
jgi:hypothetical protein